MSCPRNEEAVGWALHSLEPDEELALLRHLPDCPSCRRIAGDAEEVLSRLGGAVEQVEPPAALRDRLMDRVAQTPQEPATPSHPSPSPDPAPASTRRDGGRGPVRPADNRPGRGAGRSLRARRLLAGALALVAVLAIGGLAVRNGQLAAQRDAEAAQAQSLSQLIDQLGRPDVPHALLSREDGTTVAAVVVENGRQQVFPIGLPANAVDRNVYVLWGIADGASSPQPLGTFDVAAGEVRPLAVGESTGVGFAAYAVSLEPGRTMPAAPTDVVAKGAVAA